MNAVKIINYLESIFPLNLQMSWDKCGIQVGDCNQQVTSIMVALNADIESLQKAIDQNCQMLVTHHPFLLEEIMNHGKFIEMAIKNNILVYSLHTCLDRGKDGISMNDWLINALGVHDVSCYDEFQVGKMALLNQPCMTSELVKKVKDTFNVPVRLAGKEVEIKTIAICGGSGIAAVGPVLRAKDSEMSVALGTIFILNDIVLIDVPHHLEVIMEKRLASLLSNLGITVKEANSQDYYSYY